MSNIGEYLEWQSQMEIFLKFASIRLKIGGWIADNNSTWAQVK